MTTRSFVLIALATAGAVAMGTWQAKPTEPPTFQGWVEADFVFVGPDEPGRVETLSVREGDTVTPGAPLFTVDSDLQKAAVQQDEATLANAQQTFNRAQELLKTGVGSRKDYDNARATLHEAEARLSSARTRLTRRNVFAPADATVQQIYFRPGEVIPSGRPVISLLPPGNVKVRFFVPQAMVPQIARGDTIMVTCDGCASAISARISFISKKAEYTPPVVYSLEERAKLVFLIEARPDQPELMRVGQPLRVALARREAAR
jgi:HlyD family secretion protein